MIDDDAGVRTLLRLDRLGKDFGKVTALHELDCRVGHGEIVGLLGPNGAGKTTTMKLVLGLLKPTRGRALVGDLDCTHDARAVKALLGYSPDEPAFYDFLTGRETIDFVTNVRALDRARVWQRLEPLVAGLEVVDQLDAAVGGYSHGTKKKLALLVALAHAPSVLLLDEPTNGLDPPSAAFAKAHLRSLSAEGVAIVISTHLLEMADGLCDRVLVLHKGRVLADGTPDDVRAKAGVTAEATLEDAFLRLVR
jgi:ABC-2 type transport system ATP-binding protein